MKFRLIDEGFISSTFSDRTYNPSGLKRKFKDLLKDMPDELKNNIEVHHIDGFHSSSNKSLDNRNNNLALVDKNTYKELTKIYNNVEKDFLKSKLKKSDMGELKHLFINAFNDYVENHKNDKNTFIKMVK